MDRRRYLRAVALAGTAAGIAGCTGDDGPDSTSDPTGTETDGPASSPTATETPTATATPEPPSDPAQQVAVGDGLSFDPETFEIQVGETVLWEWVGPGHNVKYDEGDVPEGTGWTGTEGSRTTTYGEGHAHWHTFEVAGEYAYYCVPHQSSGMRGSFTVLE
jgi:plastocyanin